MVATISLLFRLTTDYSYGLLTDFPLLSEPGFDCLFGGTLYCFLTRVELLFMGSGVNSDSTCFCKDGRSDLARPLSTAFRLLDASDAFDLCGLDTFESLLFRLVRTPSPASGNYSPSYSFYKF